eukprot:TRINITY_DN4651_c0_g1_i1.p1 TRINITY_DN4651_c0_g1~~TRINITY_DN4651_c0_g1_i1.p1  ORF type:complete len:666 (-),score=91.01 TRINITY_DN4651_c0_g1_i1:336-2222(-)
MTPNSLQFKSGLLTPEEYIVRRDETTRAELERLEEERNKWRIYFARHNEFIWRHVITYTVYIIIITWALRLTWHLYSNETWISMKDSNMPNMGMDLKPVSHISHIVNPQPGLVKDFGLNISPVNVSDVHRRLEFTIRFPSLNSSVFSQGELDGSEFDYQIKKVVKKVFPKDAKMSEDLVDVERKGNRVDVVVRLPENTTISMLQRAYSNVQPGAMREAFVNNEEIQELLKDVPGQIVNLEEADPRIVRKMMHISEGISNANQLFTMSANELISEVSKALWKTQNELAKDLLIKTGLERDVDRYSQELAKLQSKLKDTEKQLQQTERKLNATNKEHVRKIEDIQKQNEQFKTKETKLLKQIEDLQSQVNQLHKLTEELETINKARQIEVEQLEAELAKSLQEQKNQRENLNNMEAELKVLKDNKQLLENQLIGVQKSVLEVADVAGVAVQKSEKDEVKLVHNLMETLKKQYEGLVQEVADSQNVIAEKERFLQQQQAEFAQANATNINKEKQLNSLKTELAGLQEQLKSIKGSTTDQEGVISQLKTEIAQLESDLEKSKTEVTRLTTELLEQRTISQNYRELMNMFKGFAQEISQQYNQILEREQNITEEIKKVETIRTTIEETYLQED